MPRPDELPEKVDTIIYGEDEDAGASDDKPVRVLSDFVVYDPVHGAEFVPLALLDVGGDHAFEGAGIVVPYFTNEEDAGLDDDAEDADYAPQRLRLSAIFRYSVDYDKRDEYALFTCTGCVC